MMTSVGRQLRARSILWFDVLRHSPLASSLASARRRHASTPSEFQAGRIRQCFWSSSRPKVQHHGLHDNKPPNGGPGATHHIDKRWSTSTTKRVATGEFLVQFRPSEQEREHHDKTVVDNDDETPKGYSLSMGKKLGKHTTILSTKATTETTTKSSGWSVVERHQHDRPSVAASSSSPSPPAAATSLKELLHENVLVHFLPAQYPHSVAPGYAHFALASFGASVAGSAAMVLSTQTLLLAVGVVGQGTSATTGVMAGALNWVLKDGVGQLGGVLFASWAGRTWQRGMDAHPKQWRIVSVACLDGSNLMDILSPLLLLPHHGGYVLPMACVANTLKNIGFLSVAASRAALHQSLCRAQNLGDVTAKAGTQSMMAGLLGTALGIGLSAFCLDTASIGAASDAAASSPALSYLFGFCVLSGIHQGLNYWSLRFVPLDSLNEQRMNIVLDDYLKQVFKNTISSNDTNGLPTNITPLTPLQVAQRESFLRDSHQLSWLRVGSSVTMLAPNGPHEWNELVSKVPNQSYVLNAVKEEKGNSIQVHLTFFDQATGDDLLRGVLHAHLLHRQSLLFTNKETAPSDTPDVEFTLGQIASTQSALTKDDWFQNSFLAGLKQAGWKTEHTAIEPKDAIRIWIPAPET